MPIDENGNFHPGFMQKVEGFTIAFSDWVAAGYPRRDPAETVELFRANCVPCELYDPDAKTLPIIGAKGVCNGCGCHVSDDPESLVNFITFPTKPCPLGKFGRTVDEEKPAD